MNIWTTIGASGMAALGVVLPLLEYERRRIRMLTAFAKRIEPLPGALEPLADMTVEHETRVGTVDISVGRVLLTRRDDGVPKGRCPMVIALHGLPVLTSAGEARALGKALDELAEHLT